MRALFPPRLAAAALVLAIAAGPAARASELKEPSEAGQAAIARHSLETARAFYRQDRLEAAESALRRGLAASPDDPGLHALLARVLADLERQEAAAAHRSRADALVPPLPPLPAEPLAAPSRGVLIALLPAASESAPISSENRRTMRTAAYISARAPGVRA